MSAALRDKIAHLLRLARDPRTPKHEARAAELAARKRMREGGLSAEDCTTVTAAASFRTTASAGTVCIGDPLFVISESPQHYRVAKLTPPARFSSHIVLLPKVYVRHIDWMRPEQITAIGWKGSSRIMRSVTLDRAYFQEAVMNGWNAWC